LTKTRAAFGWGASLTTPMTPEPLLEGNPTLIEGIYFTGSLALRNPSSV
jgi:hypothetical protein